MTTTVQNSAQNLRQNKRAAVILAERQEQITKSLIDYFNAKNSSVVLSDKKLIQPNQSEVLNLKHNGTFAIVFDELMASVSTSAHAPANMEAIELSTADEGQGLAPLFINAVNAAAIFGSHSDLRVHKMRAGYVIMPSSTLQITAKNLSSVPLNFCLAVSGTVIQAEMIRRFTVI